MNVNKYSLTLYKEQLNLDNDFTAIARIKDNKSNTIYLLVVDKNWKIDFLKLLVLKDTSIVVGTKEKVKKELFNYVLNLLSNIAPQFENNKNTD